MPAKGAVPSPSGFAHLRLRAPRARDGLPGGETSDRYSLRLAEIERPEPWTRDEARRWWREHLPQLSAPAPGRDRSDDFLSLQSID